MIAFSSIFAGLYGAWRLARRDPTGMAWFDDSPRGFWTSFLAAVFLLPAVLGLDVLSGGLLPLTPRKLAAELVAYAISWTAFPLVMSVVADSLDRGGLWVRYVVAYNWASVIQMAVFLPIGILAAVAPSSGAMLLHMIVTVVMLVYLAYVAHIALSVPGPVAAGIVLLDILLGALINLVGHQLGTG